MKPPPTVHELEKEVCRMDPGMRGKDHKDERQASVILLGAALGTLLHNVEDIIAKTGYSRDLVRKVVKNAKLNHIWCSGKTHCEWFDKESGGVAFFCDVAVCLGWLQRSGKKAA